MANPLWGALDEPADDMSTWKIEKNIAMSGHVSHRSDLAEGTLLKSLAGFFGLKLDAAGNRWSLRLRQRLDIMNRKRCSCC